MNRLAQHYLYENSLGLKRLLVSSPASRLIVAACFLVLSSILVLYYHHAHHHSQQSVRSLFAQSWQRVDDSSRVRLALWSLGLALWSGVLYWVYHRPPFTRLWSKVCALFAIVSPYFIVRMLMLVLLMSVLFPMPRVVVTLTEQHIDFESKAPIRSEYVLTSRPVPGPMISAHNKNCPQPSSAHKTTTLISLLGEQKLYEMLYLFTFEVVERQADDDKTVVARHATFGEKCVKLFSHFRSTYSKVDQAEFYALAAVIMLEALSYVCFALMFEPFAMLLFYLVQAVTFDAKDLRPT